MLQHIVRDLIHNFEPLEQERSFNVNILKKAWLLSAHMLTSVGFYNSFTTFKISNYKLFPTASRSGITISTDNMYAYDF